MAAGRAVVLWSSALGAPSDTDGSWSCCCYVHAWQKQDSALSEVLGIPTYKKRQQGPACCPDWQQGTQPAQTTFCTRQAISYKHTTTLQLERTVTSTCWGWTLCPSSAKFSALSMRVSQSSCCCRKFSWNGGPGKTLALKHKWAGTHTGRRDCSLPEFLVRPLYQPFCQVLTT